MLTVRGYFAAWFLCPSSFVSSFEPEYSGISFIRNYFQILKNFIDTGDVILLHLKDKRN